MQKIGRIGKGRFYLAFVYLLWSLLPHFHVLRHSHAGGAHFHASFSSAQVAMANRVLDNLAPDGLRETEDIEVGGESSSSSGRASSLDPVSAFSLAPGETGMKADRADPDRHGHFWEDPNVAGMAAFPFAALCLEALILAALAVYSTPDLRALRRFPARGPPSLLPA